MAQRRPVQAGYGDDRFAAFDFDAADFHVESFYWLMACSLQLKLTGGDAKSRGDFFACGFAGLGDCFLLGEGRLRNAHAFGYFILGKVQVFSPGAYR
ncbi:hypothetical protein D3C84_936990 [compost metagenome]